MNIRTPFQTFCMNKSGNKRNILLIGALVYDFDTKTLITNLKDRCSPLGLFCAAVYVVKNRICIITVNSDSRINGVVEYDVNNDQIITLNSDIIPVDYATFSSSGVVANDELFLLAAPFVVYGTTNYQLRKFSFETNTWSDLLCDEIPISSLCYAKGTYWMTNEQGHAKKSITSPSKTSWVNFSTPNPNYDTSHMTPFSTAQDELYLSCNAVSSSFDSAYFYKMVGDEFKLLYSWINNGGNDPIGFTCVSKNQDFSVIEGYWGGFPYDALRLYVSLEKDSDLIQKTPPNNEFITSSIRFNNEILVLTAPDYGVVNLYKTKDFAIYEPILTNITIAETSYAITLQGLQI